MATRIAEGVDYVKVFIEDGSVWGRVRQTLAPETVAAVIEAAHARGKIVLVYADSGATARLAIEAGADALAHHPNDSDPDGELVGRIAGGGRFVIPLCGCRRPSLRTDGAAAGTCSTTRGWGPTSTRGRATS